MSTASSVSGLLLPEDFDALRRAGAAVRENLRGKTVLLTGATGFMGKWLLASLALWNDACALGARCVALSRRPEAFLQRLPAFDRADIAMLKGDVRRLPTLPLPGRIDYVVHAATDALPDGGGAEMRSVIIEGTEAALRAAERCGASRFLYVGSGAVYGPLNRPAREEDDCRPEGVYGCAKRDAEELCLNAAVPFAVTVARCFAFAGPFLPLDRFAVGNFVRDRLAGRTIEILGDGEDVRSYMYPTDMTLWLWTMLVDGRPGGVYNVGSGEEIALKEAAALAAGGGGVAVRGLPEYAGGIRRRYVPCVEKAKRELGLETTVSLAESLRRWLRFYGLGNSPSKLS